MSAFGLKRWPMKSQEEYTNIVLTNNHQFSCYQKLREPHQKFVSQHHFALVHKKKKKIFFLRRRGDFRNPLVNRIQLIHLPRCCILIITLVGESRGGIGFSRSLTYALHDLQQQVKMWKQWKSRYSSLWNRIVNNGVIPMMDAITKSTIVVRMVPSMFTPSKHFDMNVPPL